MVDRETILAVAIIVVTGILTYTRAIPENYFLSIVGYIVAYFFGKSRHESEVKTLAKPTQVKRLGIVLLASGIALVLEHLINYGWTWDVKLECHGLYGLILFIIGWILASRFTKNKDLMK